jgi:hypothetical protein
MPTEWKPKTKAQRRAELDILTKNMGLNASARKTLRDFSDSCCADTSRAYKLFEDLKQDVYAALGKFRSKQWDKNG